METWAGGRRALEGLVPEYREESHHAHLPAAIFLDTPDRDEPLAGPTHVSRLTTRFEVSAEDGSHLNVPDSRVQLG